MQNAEKPKFEYTLRKSDDDYWHLHVADGRRVTRVLSPYGLGELLRDIDTPEGSVLGRVAFVIDAVSGKVLGAGAAPRPAGAAICISRPSSSPASSGSSTPSSSMARSRS